MVEYFRVEFFWLSGWIVRICENGENSFRDVFKGVVLKFCENMTLGFLVRVFYFMVL